MPKDKDKHKQQVVTVPLRKDQIEIMMMQLREYIELEKGRKQAEAYKKEQTLLQMIKLPQRSYRDELVLIQQIVEAIRIMDVFELAQGYIDNIKAQALYISNSKGDQKQIEMIMPFLSSLCHAVDIFPTMKNGQDTKAKLFAFFGQDITKAPFDVGIDPKLKLKSIPAQMQSPEMGDYLIKFCEKYGVNYEEFTKVGHKLPVQNFSFTQPQQSQGNQGMQYGLNPYNEQQQPQYPNVQQQQYPNVQQQQYPNMQQHQQQNYNYSPQTNNSPQYPNQQIANQQQNQGQIYQNPNLQPHQTHMYPHFGVQNPYSLAPVPQIQQPNITPVPVPINVNTNMQYPAQSKVNQNQSYPNQSQSIQSLQQQFQQLNYQPNSLPQQPQANTGKNQQYQPNQSMHLASNQQYQPNQSLNLGYNQQQQPNQSLNFALNQHQPHQSMNLAQQQPDQQIKNSLHSPVLNIKTIQSQLPNTANQLAHTQSQSINQSQSVPFSPTSDNLNIKQSQSQPLMAVSVNKINDLFVPIDNQGFVPLQPEKQNIPQNDLSNHDQRSLSILSKYFEELRQGIIVDKKPQFYQEIRSIAISI